MTVLESIGDYLVSNGHGTLGSTIFLAVMPESPDAMVCVYESGGQSPSLTLGAAAFAVDRPSIQVVCRATRGDYPTARDKAQSIRTLLASVVAQTISGISIMRIEASGSLIPMGEDENLRPMVSVNFDCMVIP